CGAAADGVQSDAGAARVLCAGRADAGLLARAVQQRRGRIRRFGLGQYGWSGCPIGALARPTVFVAPELAALGDAHSALRGPSWPELNALGGAARLRLASKPAPRLARRAI